MGGKCIRDRVSCCFSTYQDFRPCLLLGDIRFSYYTFSLPAACIDLTTNTAKPSEYSYVVVCEQEAVLRSKFSSQRARHLGLLFPTFPMKFFFFFSQQFSQACCLLVAARPQPKPHARKTNKPLFDFTFSSHDGARVS